MGNMLLTSKELLALGEDPMTSTYNIDKQMERVLMTREQREAERAKEEAQKKADAEKVAAEADTAQEEDALDEEIEISAEPEGFTAVDDYDYYYKGDGTFIRSSPNSKERDCNAFVDGDSLGITNAELIKRANWLYGECKGLDTQIEFQKIVPNSDNYYKELYKEIPENITKVSTIVKSAQVVDYIAGAMQNMIASDGFWSAVYVRMNKGGETKDSRSAHVTGYFEGKETHEIKTGAGSRVCKIGNSGSQDFAKTYNSAIKYNNGTKQNKEIGITSVMNLTKGNVKNCFRAAINSILNSNDNCVGIARAWINDTDYTSEGYKNKVTKQQGKFVTFQFSFRTNGITYTFYRK